MVRQKGLRLFLIWVVGLFLTQSPGLSQDLLLVPSPAQVAEGDEIAMNLTITCPATFVFSADTLISIDVNDPNRVLPAGFTPEAEGLGIRPGGGAGSFEAFVTTETGNQQTFTLRMGTVDDLTPSPGSRGVTTTVSMFTNGSCFFPGPLRRSQPTALPVSLKDTTALKGTPPPGEVSSQALVTVLENDAEVFVQTAGNVGEGNPGSGAAAVFVVSSIPPADLLAIDLQVSYTTQDQTAVAGQDYQATAGSVALTSGMVSPQIRIPILGDLVDEPNEVFILELTGVVSAPTSPTSVVDLGQNSAVATIIDDDDPPVDVLIDDVMVSEGDEGASTAIFTITTSPLLTDPDDNVEIGFQVVPSGSDPAQAQTDFQAVSGSLRLFGGDLPVTLQVPVLGDLEIEADETFDVVLNVLGGNRLANITGSGRGTILDDDEDQRLRVGVTVPRIAEGSGGGTTDFVFPLRLSRALRDGEADVVVSYQTVDGTATAGEDYEAVSGRIQFVNGNETRASITVPVFADETFEDDETFVMQLQIESGDAEFLGDGRLPATIRNDDEEETTDPDDPVDPDDPDDPQNPDDPDDPTPDPGASQPLVSFASDLFTAPEAAGIATIRVARQGNAEGVTTVIARTTRSGSATPGEDFSEVSARLRWEDGDLTDKILTVPLRQDDRLEGTERIGLVLRDPRNAVFGEFDRASIQILDQEEGTSLEIEVIGPPNRSLRPDSRVGLTVRVTDQAERPIAGVPVVWRVNQASASAVQTKTPGRGHRDKAELRNTETLTGDSGLSTNEIRIGSSLGTLEIIARVNSPESEPAVFRLSLQKLEELFAPGTG